MGAWGRGGVGANIHDKRLKPRYSKTLFAKPHDGAHMPGRVAGLRCWSCRAELRGCAPPPRVTAPMPATAAPMPATSRHRVIARCRYQILRLLPLSAKDVTTWAGANGPLAWHHLWIVERVVTLVSSNFGSPRSLRSALPRASRSVPRTAAKRCAAKRCAAKHAAKRAAKRTPWAHYIML